MMLLVRLLLSKEDVMHLIPFRQLVIYLHMATLVFIFGKDAIKTV